MDVKKRLECQLGRIREISETLLRSFETPEQWTLQVHAKANHAIWFAGHMGTTDNFFISLIDPARSEPRDAYQAKFGMGSEPSSNPGDYPSPAEVLAYMRDRRATLMQLLSTMDDAALAKPTPEGAPDFLPDVASIFETAIWHEGMHFGQITVAHRAIGHRPLFDPPAA